MAKLPREEDYYDEDDEDIIPNKLPPLKPIKKENPTNQINKEEVGALAQFHLVRASELFDMYRRLE